MPFPTLEDTIGQTPLVRLRHLAGPSDTGRRNILLAKLEGNNPAGSVKDRAAHSMISHALAEGIVAPGDTLIEATSGNTGIALAMAARQRGLDVVLVMPENLSVERRQCMAAYGARIVLTPAAAGMEHARDVAHDLQRQGAGVILDQFNNCANPRAHYDFTGPELWDATGGRITHFVSAMGTTGTIMGVSRYLKERDAKVQVIGVQPAPGAQIAGIRRWSPGYLPGFYEAHRVDRVEQVGQADAEDTARALAAQEGIFCGVSAGAACAAALRISAEVEDACIAFIVCDRGDRYLSTGLFEQ